MAFINKDWLFTITRTALRRGTRLKNGDKPNEQTFFNWVQSSVFKTESEDRARVNDAGRTLPELNGHVVLANDAEARSNAPQPSDRSLAAQPSQISTTEADSQEAFILSKSDGSDVEFNDQMLEAEVDPNIATRNNYLLRWTANFVSFFREILGELNTAIDNITTNTQNITNNSSRITTIEGVIDPTGDVKGILPVGSTTWHINPLTVTDGEWKPLDGVTEVSKWVTPGDQSSGEATIYTMLKNNYSLDNGSDPDYFKLPNFEDIIPYQQGSQLGFASGQWGGQIQKRHLPPHRHSEDSAYGGTLLTYDGSNKGFNGSHEHRIKYTASNGSTAVEGVDNTNAYRPNQTFGTVTVGQRSGGAGEVVLDNQNVFQNRITVDGDGEHVHGITGSTGDRDSTWGSNDEFLFDPPRALGGWMIKIA